MGGGVALTLAQYEARIAAFLMDATYAIFSTTLIDESVRLALHEYSVANPLAVETVVVLPGSGREIALDSLGEILGVHSVRWPYDSSVAEVWPPNDVLGFRVWWDDARAVLFLNTRDAAQPQAGDELRLWYSKPHMIQNLDSAAATTIPAPHESVLCIGAAGFCAFARATDLSETTGVSAVSTPNLAALGSRWLKEFRGRLNAMRWNAQPAGVSGAPYAAAGWTLDKWDNGDA